VKRDDKQGKVRQDKDRGLDGCPPIMLGGSLEEMLGGLAIAKKTKG